MCSFKILIKALSDFHMKSLKNNYTIILLQGQPFFSSKLSQSNSMDNLPNTKLNNEICRQ